MASDLRPVFDGIEAVCFDAFRTMVEVADRRGAYLPLLRALPGAARLEMKRRLIREDRATADWPAALGIEVDGALLAHVEADITAELASVRIRPGVADSSLFKPGQPLRSGCPRRVAGQGGRGSVFLSYRGDQAGACDLCPRRGESGPATGPHPVRRRYQAG